MSAIHCKYELFADDVRIWTAPKPPTQAQIDRAAVRATEQGWNGTSLDLVRDGECLRTVYPSDEALA